jgi:methionine biosynthesis protein MetW
MAAGDESKMTDSSAHVYRRQIVAGERTSLSVLAGLVAPGSTVLDLGTGSGALGAYLTHEKNCVCDGVTISEEEAALARDGYREVIVGDLEEAAWAASFEGRRYDAIICADVLEHLRRPQEVLTLCEALLAPGGRLLVSIPNAGYSGLVAELMHGEFRYRDEGLLDRTHLRFFTRRSVTEFLQSNRWGLDAIEPIARAIRPAAARGGAVPARAAGRGHVPIHRGREARRCDRCGSRRVHRARRCPLRRRGLLEHGPWIRREPEAHRHGRDRP